MKAKKKATEAPVEQINSVPDIKHQRVVITDVQPRPDCGNYKIKRIAGDEVKISAVIFSDGHEKLAADVLFKAEDETDWQRLELIFEGNDVWRSGITLERVASYRFTIEAWRDPFATLIDAIQKKRLAEVDAKFEANEVSRMITTAHPPKSFIEDHTRLLADLEKAKTDLPVWLDLLLSEATLRHMSRLSPREHAARYGQEIEISVERPRALFSSWYELFPRSVTGRADRHGTFLDVIAHLPYVEQLGFDVLYFPPIHPIGKSHRKGRNNSLKAAPDDPGSVYAIGSEAGGHDSIHPELGTLDDFRALIKAARTHNLEIALDFAIQCSPDHPWIKQHPEWFAWREDGTIQYAENPPKKYEDIVNVQFYGDSFPSLWYALRDIVAFWLDCGVRIFRVDNPHTKPLPFWQWLIAEIQKLDPGVIFLAEAFTRPAMMQELAKIGFQQSYTYFTWRNSKAELTEYITELSGPMSDYYRPNFFVNTPDINPHYLQTSGHAGFMIRAALAATLSSNWGVYSGFELCEAEPLLGREEYINSEKYEIKPWDFDRPGNIKAYIGSLNQIRRFNKALQDFRCVRMVNAWNDNIICYFRYDPEKTNCLLILVNLDPHHMQSCTYEVPLWEFNLPDESAIDVEDLLQGNRFTLHGKTHQIGLDPSTRPAVIWRLIPPAGWRTR